MLNFKAESYNGTCYSNNIHMHRRGVQIVATDETGKRRAVFATKRGKTPCLKLGAWASHYKSGMNKKDTEAYKKCWDEAVVEAKRLNKEQPY
jgi:hypothetical protein